MTTIGRGLALAALFLAFAACGDKSPEARFTEYGAALGEFGPLTDIAAIRQSPLAYVDQEVAVKGIIASVCPSSGCFLHLGAGTAEIEVDLVEGGFTIPPGQNVGKVAVAVGPVRVAGERVKVTARGLRILE